MWQTVLYIVYNELKSAIYFPEYDALAKVIQQHPDRLETMK